MAIARAIPTDPDILLADEPTGNLDAQSAKDVMAMPRKVRVSGRLKSSIRGLRAFSELP